MYWAHSNKTISFSFLLSGCCCWRWRYYYINIIFQFSHFAYALFFFAFSSLRFLHQIGLIFQKWTHTEKTTLGINGKICDKNRILCCLSGRRISKNDLSWSIISCQKHQQNACNGKIAKHWRNGINSHEFWRWVHFCLWKILCNSWNACYMCVARRNHELISVFSVTLIHRPNLCNVHISYSM